jgi:flagellar biosynthetic protein FlhB
MPEEQFQERTEKATPRKRKKVREEGRVARSQELNSAVMLLLGTTAIYFMAPVLGDQLHKVMTTILRDAPLMDRSFNSILSFFSNRIVDFFIILAPIFAILAVIAYGINVLQVGILFSSKALEPKLDKLNIVNGFKRLISVRSLVELVRDVLKITVIAVVGYKIISSHMDTYFMLSDNTVSVFTGTMGTLALTTTLKIAAVLLLLALFDYAYQKYDFEKNIKMSKQEIKDEMKDTEGSPQIKQRVRQIQRDMVRRRMMTEIPQADVVVTNPTHIAIALKYEADKMDAPMVVAKGERLLAERIKEIALESDVPVVENKPLARALFKMCDVGSYVPAKLYRAVAEVLAYVYRLRGTEVN